MPLYVADTSAWHRSGATPRIERRWGRLLAQEAVVLCAPVELELLYSARSRADYAELASDLRRFPHVPLDDRVAGAAAAAQALLAQRSEHRGPTPIDLMIAATAAVHDAILLHYDRHFDAIARVTGQPTEWLARRGSLD